MDGRISVLLFGTKARVGKLCDREKGDAAGTAASSYAGTFSGAGFVSVIEMRSTGKVLPTN